MRQHDGWNSNNSNNADRMKQVAHKIMITALNNGESRQNEDRESYLGDTKKRSIRCSELKSGGSRNDIWQRITGKG